jgi:hypothetical protein
MAAVAQVRSALVLATAEYGDEGLSRLRSPVNDAEAVGRVLADPAIGNFDVTMLVNETEARQRREVGRFFADRGRADLLLLYISCHGLKDERGDLYLAASDTQLGNLAATALPAGLINQLMTDSRSQAVVVVLDCCYSGAFGRGMAPKAAGDVDVLKRFSGRGRVVITASSALEYAFEGTDLASDGGGSSVFTSAFVRGLETGQADLDQDGQVTADELYEYIYDQVHRATPNQAPKKFSSSDGQIVIARNPRFLVERVSWPPASVRQLLDSPVSPDRARAVDLLLNLALDGSPRTVEAVRAELVRLEQDDSRAVAAAAMAALDRLPKQSRYEPDARDEEAQSVSEPESDDADQGGYRPEPVASSDYWTTGDQLEYEPYATAIAEFIQHEGTEPPLTIGIKAPWGAGKTSLMRMVRDRLDPPTPGGVPVGGRPRRQVPLTAGSRRLLAGGRGYRTRGRAGRRSGRPASVTNGTVWRKLSDLARHPLRRDKAAELHIDAAGLGAWRPTVWFNPWMYQSGEQIWAGLAHEIISQLTERMVPADREAFWLELNLRRVDADRLRHRIHRALLERLVPLAIMFAAIVLVAGALFLARLLVSAAAGPLNVAAGGLFAAGSVGTVLAGIARAVAFWREHVAGTLTTLVQQPDYAKRWQRLAEEQSKDLLRDPGYENRLGLLHLVHTDMRQVLNLVATSKRPVVVFVDDLDRCTPGAVAQVIEAINLFLAGEFPNCVFVLAMEPDMVAAHIEAAYKPLVDTLAGDDYWGAARSLGWRFLDKIVQLPVSLPILRSDQADQFLGTMLAAGPRTPSNHDQGLDEREVDRIEQTIRQREPSLDNITQTAADAQEQVTGESVRARGFRPETQAAMRRELRRRLRPDDPEIQAIVAGVAGRLDRNPREIKRFVNVFRFYAVIRQEREAAGLPAPDTLDEIAKLAVLAIRWPHLRAVLSRQIGPTERDTVLSLLEGPVAELPNDAIWPARREALQTVLADAQIPKRLRTNLLASEDLCQFLTCAPPIGTTAAGYL